MLARAAGAAGWDTSSSSVLSDWTINGPSVTGGPSRLVVPPPMVGRAGHNPSSVPDPAVGPPRPASGPPHPGQPSRSTTRRPLAIRVISPPATAETPAQPVSRTGVRGVVAARVDSPQLVVAATAAAPRRLAPTTAVTPAAAPPIRPREMA